jgi:uncharacterized protein (DUF1697 family)
VESYVAFLRGINVGGNNIIRMAELRDALAAAGIDNVRTYIQSGNVLCTAPKGEGHTLATQIEAIIADQFTLKVEVAVFSKPEWKKVIAEAPKTWGVDTTWKHNILIMIGSHDMQAVIAAIGELKPDIERADAGEGVIYQSLSLAQFGRTTGGKLASNPVYKRMTIRNYNTATKLLALL